MTRPDILFPLFAELTSLDGVGPKTAQLLARIEIDKPGRPRPDAADLRRRPPAARLDPRGALPDVVTVEVEIGLHQPPGAARPPLPHPRPRRR